ncbi:MAG: DUF2182 domain-containing protein [Rhizobiaceae bacterium]|nr:DUF2182 domain-containing protein [Rhizobiaceae bacterium]
MPRFDPTAKTMIISSIATPKSQRDLGGLVLRRDIILGAAFLAWIYLIIQSFQFAVEGTAQDLGPGMMIFDWLYQQSGMFGAFSQNIWSICVTKIEAWGISDFSRVFLMWQIMIIAMMAPTLLFRKLYNMEKNYSFSKFSRFIAGYLFAWSLFSIPMVLLQWGLQTNGLLTDGMMIGIPWFSTVMLIALVGFQLNNWRHKTNSDQSGFQLGLNCIRTNWPLMLSMFAFGLMNLIYMAVLTVLMIVFLKDAQKH